MVDAIIATRVGTCEKVQVITHGTGGNATLVAASDPTLNFAQKVGKIVAMAPCIVVNIDEFWLPVRDLASIDAFYASLAEFNINSLFSIGADPNLDAYCNSGGVNTAICLYYIRPAQDNLLLRQTSMKDFEHAQQNASVNQFRPFEEDVTELTKIKPGYEVSKITIPVAGIFSEDDEACTAGVNQLRMVDIPGFTSTTHSELYIDHVGIIADNSAFTVGSIKEYLSDMAIEVENTLLCPIEPEPVEPEEVEEPEPENWDCEIRLLSSDSGSGSGSDSDSSNSGKKK